MFNNLFESFHDTVADAKNEREELDSLLTISTPKERLLIAGVVVALVTFGAWLMFGSVTRSVVVDGVLVTPTEVFTSGEQVVEFVVWTAPSEISEIQPGMETVIVPQARNLDGLRVVAGEIRSIAKESLLNTYAPHRTLQKISIAVDYGVALSRVAATEYELVVKLGHQTPIELFRKSIL